MVTKTFTKGYKGESTKKHDHENNRKKHHSK